MHPHRPSYALVLTFALVCATALVFLAGTTDTHTPVAQAQGGITHLETYRRRTGGVHTTALSWV